MTSTERIHAALGHTRPDRVPRYEIFLDNFRDAWRRETQAGDGANIYDHYSKIDIGTILASQEGPFLDGTSTRQDGEDRYVRDSWGRLTRHRKTAALFEVMETALSKKSDLDRLDFGDPRRAERRDLAALQKRATQVRARFAPVGGVMGLFMPSYYLRGETAFLMDLVDDAQFCHALIGRVADFITALGECVLDRTQTWDTALWVYDDFGSNRGPLMSPRTFETFFLPAYKRMISYWRSKGLANVILHYDSNCWAILDMLIDAGFTGIQGIYPAAGMTVPDVKARYGDKLSLIGGMCNVSVLAPGPVDRIRDAVSSIIEVARDGGVVIGAHSVDDDVPREHYDAYDAMLNETDEAW